MVLELRRADVRNGEIHFAQEKTGTEMVIPLHPKLVESMKACPAKGLALFGQANGRPIAGDGVAGLPSRCVPHGLRKARAKHASPRRPWRSTRS
jgi:hypothetical protein